MSGGVQAMSRPSDAPQLAPTAAMEPSSKTAHAAAAAAAAAAIPMPQTAGERPEDHPDLAPQSAADVAEPPVVTDSPAAMDLDVKGESIVPPQVAMQEERQQPTSLSYPGSLQAGGALEETPGRGMSFLVPSRNASPPASVGKKHKCPYCNTEFTRHHNLKSHLLTHSQEKPYLCNACQMRFRRLHDLKRHGKLHTGEKPHICPKCDRKFARGDALARHSKGVGGCAGRRSSMGGFGDGDELDGGIGDGDENVVMTGIAYDNNGDDEELRRQSVAGVTAQHLAAGQGDQFANAHARSYPPAAAAAAGTRGANSGLFPPNISQAQAAGGVAPSVSNNVPGGHAANVQVAAGGPGIYPQTTAGDGTKPSSPGFHGHEPNSVGRQRSPSLAQQMQQQQQQQQQQMGRRQSELQSPHGGQIRPKLPALSHPSHPGFQPSNSAGVSHGRTPSGATPNSDSGNMFAQSDPSVWAYIQTLEEKVKTLSDKVFSLDHEVAGLKKQLENQEGVAAG
ncbi:Transcriptional regulator prz1 [Escovopsis weberi]|uniref:Transcriptional regulator prz1 n=1 Tax=Escovopsis weberi TaxID=150374 RepID=A0A0M9VVI1_ESCWE|nr:Transcriptional regulator prz1 [Escovopsis weberi]